METCVVIDGEHERWVEVEFTLEAEHQGGAAQKHKKKVRRTRLQTTIRPAQTLRVDSRSSNASNTSRATSLEVGAGSSVDERSETPTLLGGLGFGTAYASLLGGRGTDASQHQRELEKLERLAKVDLEVMIDEFLSPSIKSRYKSLENMRHTQIMQECHFMDPRYYFAHLNLPLGHHGKVVPVYADEAGSFIAYTLSSLEYAAKMAGLTKEYVEFYRHETVNGKRFKTSQEARAEFEAMIDQRRREVKRSAIDQLLAHVTRVEGKTLVDYLTNKDKYMDGIERKENRTVTKPLKFFDKGHKTQQKGGARPRTQFECTVFFHNQFEALRSLICGGDEIFIQSLARDTASFKGVTGGKSQASFMQSRDERYMFKFVDSQEFQMFIKNAHAYFDHMARSLFKKYPTVLCQILGAFTVSWKKDNDPYGRQYGFGPEASPTKHVLVMPNIFYNKQIVKVFDLKGSKRNRYLPDPDPKATLLDHNFLEFTRGHPLPLDDQSKEYLHAAIHNDTLYLERNNIVDYSMLVGMDHGGGKKTLVLGIIDYLRIYTWDKRIESGAKSMISPHVQPTIVSPKNYKGRFRDEMNRYFMVSPDRSMKRPVYSDYTKRTKADKKETDEQKRRRLLEAVTEIYIVDN